MVSLASPSYASPLADASLECPPSVKVACAEGKLEVDVSYIQRVAARPDAEVLVREHHTHLFNIHTQSAGGRYEDETEIDREIVEAGRRRLERLNALLGDLQEFIHHPGGGQPRTWHTWGWVLLFSLGILGLWVCDFIVVSLLLREFGGFSWARVLTLGAGMALFPMLFLKAALHLRHDVSARLNLLRRMAPWVWTVCLVLWAAAAYQLYDLRRDPVDILTSASGAGGHPALMIGLTLAQLMAQAAGAVILQGAVSRCLYDTRPVYTESQEAHAKVRLIRDREAEAYVANRRTLAGSRALLGTHGAKLAVYLGNAAVALGAERTTQEAMQLSINLRLRQAGRRTLSDMPTYARSDGDSY